jgi:two-component system NarL family response regulator
MSPDPIQILLVEDDELFRLGLVTRLTQESALQVVAEAEDGESAIALVGQQIFDIVILDVGLPGIGGIEACHQIKQLQPHLPVLILTSHSRPALIKRLIEAQAQGYCVKGVAAETLILAIRSLAAGASWWDAIASQQIQTAFRTDLAEVAIEPSDPAPNPLTKREQEILTLIASGKSNQEIAEALYIAPGTVRVHVHTILQKLEVRDRTQAAIRAIQMGLVLPSENFANEVAE